MLAKSPNSAGLILVAAVSGRALAQAARRAGYRVRVADFFGDDDTVAAAEKVVRLPGSLRDGVDAERLVGVLKELAAGESTVTMAVDAAAVAGRIWRQAGNVDALILGSGFERIPELVDELARYFPLAGNRGDAIRRVKNPESLAVDCAELGIPHPKFCWAEPADLQNWISKRVGGAGGVHVQRGSNAEWRDLPPPLTPPHKGEGNLAATLANPPPPCGEGLGVGVTTKASSGSGFQSKSRYFQHRIEGQNISALFIADGERAHLVGFSRQWTSPTMDAPFRYGGAVRLRRFDRGDAARISVWLSGLTARAGLVGLCSADFIRNRDGYHLIEINPRPGATLDIFDTAQAPLIRAHIKACRNRSFDLPRFDDSKASLVAYAKKPLAAFPEIDWPAWTADRQSSCTQLDSGDPVCTVFAYGRSAEAARRSAYDNLRRLEGAWGGGQP